MGLPSSGKSAMRSIIFNECSLREACHVPSTRRRFAIELWECSEKALLKPKELYSDAKVVVYTIDTSNKSIGDEYLDFREVVDNLLRFSPEVKLVVLLHKYDLVTDNPTINSPPQSPVTQTSRPHSTSLTNQTNRHLPLREWESKIKRIALPLLANCLHTSIWDESLYRAWSSIVTSAIGSNYVMTIQSELGRMVERLKCQEIILIDSQTSLVLAHSINKPRHRHHHHNQQQQQQQESKPQSYPETPTSHHAGHIDVRRMEKISNILKQSRLVTKKFNSILEEVHLEWGNELALELHPILPDSLLLLVGPPPQIPNTGSTTMGVWRRAVDDFRSVLMALVCSDPDTDPHAAPSVNSGEEPSTVALHHHHHHDEESDLFKQHHIITQEAHFK